jgi:hypothetical protein
MEHPLVQIDSEISIDDLTEKINELTRKLGIAYRSGNRNLASQINMALETYKNRLTEKQEELYNSRNKNSPDFSNKINVS